jgi:hypothetical protein
MFHAWRESVEVVRDVEKGSGETVKNEMTLQMQLSDPEAGDELTAFDPTPPTNIAIPVESGAAGLLTAGHCDSESE